MIFKDSFEKLVNKKRKELNKPLSENIKPNLKIVKMRDISFDEIIQRDKEIWDKEKRKVKIIYCVLIVLLFTPLIYLTFVFNSLI